MSDAFPRPCPVVVGYTTRPIEDGDMSERLAGIYAAGVSAPVNYKSADKIQEFKDAALSTYEEAAADQPYTAMLDKVRIIDPSSDAAVGWDSEGRTEGKKKSVAEMTANWFRKQYKAFLGLDGSPPGTPPAYVIYAFDPLHFLKMLGTECAVRGRPLPPSMWLQMGSYCDIRSCLMPGGYRHLNFSMALAAFGETIGTVRTSDFKPRVNPEDDIKLIFELLVLLDLLKR